MRRPVSSAASLCLGRPTGPKLKTERKIYKSVKEELGELWVTSHSLLVLRRAIIVCTCQARSPEDLSLASMSPACFPPGLGGGAGVRAVLTPLWRCCISVAQRQNQAAWLLRWQNTASLCHSSDKSIRWKTAGVMHYLSLCNKQMPFRMLWFILSVVSLHWLSPKTASEGKGRIIWSISCHNIGKMIA